MRAYAESARGERPSDCEGRRPSRIWLDRICGKNVAARRRADRIGVAVEPVRQSRQVWQDKRHSLGGEAAKRTLIAAMAGRRVLGRSLVVVDLDAELRSVAKDRLELGGDRRVVGVSEGGRSKRRRCRSGEKLNDERERDEKRHQRRSRRGRRGAFARTRRPAFRPPLSCGPSYDHRRRIGKTATPASNARAANVMRLGG